MMRRLILIALALLYHSTVWAHKASDSYLVVDAKGATVSVQWDIALRDIDFAIGLDANGNGEITGRRKIAIGKEPDAFAEYLL